MAQYNQEDPNMMGESLAQKLPGAGILQMLMRAGQQIPQGMDRFKELLGLRQAPPVLRPGQMATPRDAQGRPLPIDPQTGLPINYPPQAGGNY